MPPYDNDHSILNVPATTKPSATCLPSASWAFNSKGQSSCAIASTILGACNNSPAPIFVSPLNGTYVYLPPDGAYANQCTCSWMAYNLLSACTACQEASGISTWDDYSKDCAAFEIDNFFPSTAFIQNTTFIPVWATLSPSNWTERKFDVLQVQSIIAQDEPDIELTSDTWSGSTMSGGIIGGAIVLSAVVLGLATLLIFRWRRRIENKTKAQARWKQFDLKFSRLKAGQEKPPALQVRQRAHVPALPAARIDIPSVDTQAPIIFKNSRHNVSLARSLGFEIFTPQILQAAAHDSRHIDNGGPPGIVPINFDPRPKPHLTTVNRGESLTSFLSTQAAIGHENGATAAVSSSLSRIYNPSTSHPSRTVFAHHFSPESNSISTPSNSRMVETNARLRSTPSRPALSNETRRNLLPRLVIAD